MEETAGSAGVMMMMVMCGMGSRDGLIEVVKLLTLSLFSDFFEMEAVGDFC